MPVSSPAHPAWLAAWFKAQGIELWGAADLRDFPTPRDARGRSFPRALSWALPMDPRIMAGLGQGPTPAYAEAYDRVNDRLNHLSRLLADELSRRGHGAEALAASERTDKVNIRGDFPHKTAATRAGLGWIGRHCQLVTRPFGPWVRLGTVFTDLELVCGPPVTRHFCGSCQRCVEACPARALTGQAWHPGLPRAAILAAESCDAWKKAHYFAYHAGHVCGICTSACPYGLKFLQRACR